MLPEAAEIYFESVSSTQIKNATIRVMAAPASETDIFITTNIPDGPFTILNPHHTIATTSLSSVIEMELRFDPSRHPHESSEVAGLLLVQKMDGAVIGQCSLVGFRGPALELEDKNQGKNNQNQ